MTDAEREAREYVAEQEKFSGWAREDNFDRLVVLLSLLDGVYIERNRLGDALQEARDEIRQLETEVARLTAPPGASAIDKAKDVVNAILTRHQKLGDTAHSHPAVDWSEIARVIEAAERRGRAAMREEAAQVALKYRNEADTEHYTDIGDPDHSLGQSFAANRIAKRIRALPDDAPAATQGVAADPGKVYRARGTPGTAGVWGHTEGPRRATTTPQPIADTHDDEEQPK